MKTERVDRAFGELLEKATPEMEAGWEARASGATRADRPGARKPWRWAMAAAGLMALIALGFVPVKVGDATGALERLAAAVVALAGDSETKLVPVVCVFSAAASAIVDNIPVTATLIPIIDNIQNMGVAQEPLWWSLVLGSNLGGSGTPIGSISCVIALHALKKEAKISVGWGEFIKIGGLIMTVQVVGAVVYLMLLRAIDVIPPIPPM